MHLTRDTIKKSVLAEKKEMRILFNEFQHRIDLGYIVISGPETEIPLKKG
jgi:hypothetical protein